ncbi:hypothetical protein SUGI_0797820 [Cryptomeria japonica]|nr:hypothetical protein SUGI_0797820 [Cryptomeria japonica]
MTKTSKKQGAKEWYIQVADSEQRYTWFDDLKGRFEFFKAEDDKPDDKSGKLSSVSINKVPLYLKGLRRDAYLPRVVSLGLYYRRISQPLSQRELCKGVPKMFVRETGEQPAEHKEREAKLTDALQLKYRNLKEYNHIL